MAESEDKFKEQYNNFKRKNVPKYKSNIVDFELKNSSGISIITSNELFLEEECSVCKKNGLVSHQNWELFSFKGLDGFFYIKNPYSVEGQQFWIRKCLEDYSRKPSITNLDAQYRHLDDIWALQNDNDLLKRNLINKLSWATLGYHHNWDTKLYNPDNYSTFPLCLAELSEHIASCLGFKNFKPQAAIVNYYNAKSSLGVHNDHSEEELEKPILSFSFGQTAIFLIGTNVRTDKPVPMFLRSGDIIILSGSSRLSYHAVPSIFKENIYSRYSLLNKNKSFEQFHNYVKNHRINISVRQVYKILHSN